MSWVSNLVQNMEQEGEETLLEGSFSKQNHDINKAIPLSCDICRKTFDKMSLLVTHVVVYHGKDDTDDIKPTVTTTRPARRNRKSGKARLYMVHKYFETHKPFTCGQCTRSFAYKYQLGAHMDTHVEKRIFSCDVCKRVFLEEEQLVAHRNTKPYDPSACDVCGKKFASWSLLSTHRLEHVSHEDPVFRD